MQPEHLGYIGLGSNLGDRLGNLRRAVSALGKTPGFALLRASGVYESPPWGYRSANAYLNAVIEIAWAGGAEGLVQRLLQVEQAGSRTRAREARAGYADRSIDLDLLWLGGLRLTQPGLNLPHPRAHLRVFVLKPWLELAPELELHGKRLAHWLALLPREEVEGVVLFVPAARRWLD
jgi:2-amino-4-hydroxy-6-hydroxymethyldihydropteridine diphosphokinase